MKNIAILTGGDSAERVISLKSGQVVYDQLPKNKYRCFMLDIQHKDWKDIVSGVLVDKNDFTLTIQGEKIHFDAAFAAIHGSPLEDGKMQGYLEMMGIPYTCCNGYVSALTMNKHHTKMQLAQFGDRVPMAKSRLFHRGEVLNIKQFEDLGLPVFVKPNTHGSSFGVSKVKTREALQPAIEEALQYDTEVVVESYLPGREFGNGAMRVGDEIVVFPITEIIPEDEFFTFAAKYEGRSKEVTPADVSSALEIQCKELTRFLYQVLQCKGVVRFDYILVNEIFHFLECNSIPGISPASIVPQQAVAHGWTLSEFFALMVEETLRENKA